MCGKELKDDVTNMSILDNVVSKYKFLYILIKFVYI